MRVHVVQRGDTLWKIANMYGVSLGAVIAANPQIPDPDRIEVGMKVNVPDAMPPSEMPFDAFPMPEEGGMTKYVVQSGDTLWKIAQKTGHSLAHLIAANPQIANPDLIMPGQVINIPAPGMVHSPAGMPMHPKEKLTMPKPKITEVKPVETAPVPPPPAPVAPPPMPVVIAPLLSHQHHVDLTMLDYHPHYVVPPPVVVPPPIKVEVKEKPKMVMPKMEKPKVKPVVKPCPPPVYHPCPPAGINPCPPGTYPAIVDEFGNFYPYPFPFVTVRPYLSPPYMMPSAMRAAAGIGPGTVPGDYGSGEFFSGMAPESAEDWRNSFPAMPKWAGSGPTEEEARQEEPPGEDAAREGQ